MDKRDVYLVVRDLGSEKRSMQISHSRLRTMEGRRMFPILLSLQLGKLGHPVRIRHARFACPVHGMMLTGRFAKLS